MKNNKILLLICIFFVGGYNFYSAQQTDNLLDLYFADIESLANPEGDGSGCKWKIYDCPGWGTGDYEACLVIGDGHSCSCGSVTRDCPKK